VNDPRREILNQVATGLITAEEGAARLEALETNASPSPAAPAPLPAPAQAGTTVKQVRIVSRFGNTEVIGDPTVSYAVAEGPHRARQDGDTMVIEQSLLNDDTTFEFSRPQGRVRIGGVGLGSKLTVRMNPALALSAKVQAGNLSVDGVQGSVAGEIQAGNCTLNDFRGPVRLHVTAGNVAAHGRLDSGASSIRCQMGEVRVVLAKTSSVRINAHSTMGEVAVEGVEQAARPLTIGTGEGTLECDCTMGTIRIVVE
jgi:hypothetical protein